MTAASSRTPLDAPVQRRRPATRPGRFGFLPPGRYRHPCDAIRLIAAALLVAPTLAVTLMSGGAASLRLIVAVAAVAAGAAVAAAAAPWLSRRIRRGAWLGLLAAAVTLWITGTAPAMELAAALGAGTMAGAGALLAFGAPDRRLGPDAIAAELRSAGVPVAWVRPAAVAAKGSRPFAAATAGGWPLFIKVFGSDERDADLLYRAYRFLRLRGVGDTRPAASLGQAVEHEALASIMAERAGVAVAPVRRVVRAGDGSVLLAMDRIDGTPLGQPAVRQIGDALLRAVWAEVARLHRAGIAHRALRAANIVIDRSGRPWLVDFGFSDLAATGRQRALDVAELLASLATIAGADAAVAGAAAVLGRDAVAATAPVLQPLALSAATRCDVARHPGLLVSLRKAAGRRVDQKLAHLQRVRPKTLVTMAVLAGAFYFLLPQLAQVGSGWRAVTSAGWAWVPLIIAFSAASYLAAALSISGAVPDRIRFWPTLLAQNAASFFNRVSPANVGGMALTVRYLQRSGVDTGAGAAAVGVNSAAGAVVHLVLIVIFFAWSGQGLARAFQLPAGGKILLIVAVVIAIAGVVLAGRPGRRFATAKVVPLLRSAATSLRLAAASPVKMSMLFGGSALITLSYIGALAAAVMAFGGGQPIPTIGAVYLGAAAIAAAAPTPGGLGAIEAALVAGLTGTGMRPGPAVAAVLLYRLATYWLPVAPGWLSWRVLQHWGYL
jgi:glycosyltransferase 2 family protein